MAEYIEREAAYAAAALIALTSIDRKMTCGEVKKIMESIPAADVKPVVRGEWVRMSDADGDYYCCSTCGNELPRYAITQVTVDNPFPKLESIYKTPFCPNCGADMRGKQ